MNEWWGQVMGELLSLLATNFIREMTKDILDSEQIDQRQRGGMILSRSNAPQIYCSPSHIP